METLETIRQLWRHAVWADTKLVEAVARPASCRPDAVAELAHIVGAYEVWLARLEGRPPCVDVWPTVTADDIETLLGETSTRFASYLASLTSDALSDAITYTNSAGREFTSTVHEILLHVTLHGQYHRGKVNLMLRNAGLEPAATDFIAMVRGAPAATRKLT